MAGLADAIGKPLHWNPEWLPAVRAVGSSSDGFPHSRHAPQQRRTPISAALPLPAIQERSHATIYEASGRLAPSPAGRVGQRVNLFI